MLLNAYCEENTGIGVQYHTDGKLFNLQSLQGVTKISFCTVPGLLFANGCALLKQPHLYKDILIYSSYSSYKKFTLNINTPKTAVMYQPVSGVPYEEPILKVYEHPLTVVDKFSFTVN